MAFELTPEVVFLLETFQKEYKNEFQVNFDPKIVEGYKLPPSAWFGGYSEVYQIASEDKKNIEIYEEKASEILDYFVLKFFPLTDLQNKLKQLNIFNLNSTLFAPVLNPAAHYMDREGQMPVLFKNHSLYLKCKKINAFLSHILEMINTNYIELSSMIKSLFVGKLTTRINHLTKQIDQYESRNHHVAREQEPLVKQSFSALAELKEFKEVKEESKFLEPVLLNPSSHQPNLFIELINYRDKREQADEFYLGGRFLRFFGIGDPFSRKDKGNAVDEILLILEGASRHAISKRSIEALKQGELGSIIARYKNQYPRINDIIFSKENTLHHFRF